MNIRKNKAYTMAEILIVMAIFAIAMTLLIRTIVRVDPDKNKILFIKAYHATEEILALSMNDETLYDQNIYTKADITNWEGEKHFNLADAPLKDAEITFINNGERKKACLSGCDENLTKNNAPCYHIARYINTIGPVNCNASNSTDMNMRTSNGVCYYGWTAAGLGGTTPSGSTQKSFDAVIDPSCSRSTDNKSGYAVRVYASGAMEIPEESDLTTKTNQEKALQWLKSPTTVD